MGRIVEYTIINCPYCFESDLATLLANASLPIGKRIPLIFFHSKDSRLSFLGKLPRKNGGYLLPSTMVKSDVGNIAIMGSLFRICRYYMYKVLSRI